MLARPVDLLDHVRQRHSLKIRNFFQVVPKGIFEAHARLVSTKDDGAFGHQRLHGRFHKSFHSHLLMIRYCDVGRNIPYKKLSHRCNRHSLLARFRNVKNQQPFRFLKYRLDYISLDKSWLSNLQRIAASLPANQLDGFISAI